MKSIFKTIVPGWKGVNLPKEFPLLIRFVLHASVLLVHIYAFRIFGLPFGMIGDEKREKVITKLYHHSNATIRNIVQFWKLTALMTQC